MKNKFIDKKRKGFTLVELVLIVMLLSLALSAVFAFTTHSLKMGDMQKSEVNFQGDMRDTMLLIDERIKKSSAVFAVTESEFMDDEGHYLMDPSWTYIGVSKSEENKGQICIFENKDGEWKEEVLSAGDKDIHFNLTFDKETEEGAGQKVLSYTVVGSDPEETRSLTSKSEVLSAYTVVDKGTDDDKAVALAFRNGVRKFPKSSSVTFLIDVSLSMNQDMSITNNDGTISMKPRHEIVSKILKEMMATLSDTTSVDVGLVDFSNYGTIVDFDNPNEIDHYLNLNDNYKEVNKVIEKVAPERISSAIRGGSTNFGDGLRIAYNMAEKRNEALEDRETRFNYVILLVDGDSTYTTGIGDEDTWYYGDLEFTSRTPPPGYFLTSRSKYESQGGL